MVPQGTDGIWVRSRVLWLACTVCSPPAGAWKACVLCTSGTGVPEMAGWSCLLAPCIHKTQPTYRPSINPLRIPVTVFAFARHLLARLHWLLWTTFSYALPASPYGARSARLGPPGAGLRPSLAPGMYRAPFLTVDPCRGPQDTHTHTHTYTIAVPRC